MKVKQNAMGSSQNAANASFPVTSVMAIEQTGNLYHTLRYTRLPQKSNMTKLELFKIKTK
ncbi:hypothetical protein N7517_009381 [Penicillium concentricum]|uniref:Uncharacterized protein n=1 Tax=Penicillium concentricum TaxID=293559 RepID=A0A9W9UYT8_9EURO|nr:uncharacterized protein N7517_009381 [Penicillium concentricum]KAJ5360190.1 hypothetical protein N7517_009381 [Penicillium concentricum]